MTDIHDLFGPAMIVYTRAQAIKDGVLVDVTKWATNGPDGMMGGFTVPVAVTANVWADLNDIPAWAEGWQDVRGRAHDLLFMASLAARRGAGSEALFDLILPLSSDPRPVVRDGRRNNRPQHTYKLLCGPDDSGAPCVTILRPEED